MLRFGAETIRCDDNLCLMGDRDDNCEDPPGIDVIDYVGTDDKLPKALIPSQINVKGKGRHILAMSPPRILSTGKRSFMRAPCRGRGGIR